MCRHGPVIAQCTDLVVFLVISKVKPKSAGISCRANKPPSARTAQLAYKLGCHKSSIRPRSSAAYVSNCQYNSIAPSKPGFVVHWRLSVLRTAAE